MRRTSNVTFVPLQPLEKLNELLNMADVHLLPQRVDASDLVMPSKLTGMLASGPPVIAMALPGSSLERAMQSCGLIVRPEDEDDLARAIQELATNASSRAEMGRQARARTVEELSADAILSKSEAQLVELCSRRRSAGTGPDESVPVGTAPIGDHTIAS